MGVYILSYIINNKVAHYQIFQKGVDGPTWRVAEIAYHNTPSCITAISAVNPQNAIPVRRDAPDIQLPTNTNVAKKYVTFFMKVLLYQWQHSFTIHRSITEV
jgi:hypothetical protein